MSDEIEEPDLNEDEIEDLQRVIDARQSEIDDMKRTADGWRRRADAMDARREEAIRDLRAQRLLLREGKLALAVWRMHREMGRMQEELAVLRASQEQAGSYQ